MRVGRRFPAVRIINLNTRMNSSCNLIARAFAGVALSITLCAPLAAAEAGLIGKRYVGPDFTYDHFSGSVVDKAFGAAVDANLPLSSAFDLKLGYSYTDASGDNYDALEKRASASVLSHRLTEYGTAYFAATLGHSWQSGDAAGVSSRNNSAFWGARAGYEIPVGRQTAIDAGIGYVDSFERKNPSAQVLGFHVGANHWFSRDLAGVLSVAYRQIKAAPDGIAYTAGLRWAF